MPSDFLRRWSRRATLVALAAWTGSVGAVPVTMVFTSAVAEAPAGPGTVPLSGEVRLTYSFDSTLAMGSGPVPTSPGLASYGPIAATLDFRGTSIALVSGNGITIYQLPHAYIVGGRAQDVTIDGSPYANLSFSFALFDSDNQVFSQLALPLDEEPKVRFPNPHACVNRTPPDRPILDADTSEYHI